MKLLNPPVALMFHEGAPRLAACDLHVPALRDGGSSKVALEAYPGLLVRKQLRILASYKSDTRSEQTPARKAARRAIVQELLAGRPLGVRLELRSTLLEEIVADGSGDLLDAVICAAQAAWAWRKREANFGLPLDAPAGEGWIVTA